VWFGGSFGYGLYAWLSYSGPFRWLADFEMDHFGSYQERLTAIAVGLMTLGLSAPIFLLVDRVIRRRRGLHPASTTAAPIGERPVRKTHVLRAILVLGLGAIVVATGAGVLGYRKLQESVPFEPLNLADGTQPRSSHVELTGLALPSLQIVFTERYTTTTYMPLVPPQWHKGDPVVYFLAQDGDHLDSDRHSFQVRQQGVLMRDLPGAVASRYEKGGIKLGTPPIVLDAAEHDDLIPYWITAAVAGSFGLPLLFAVLQIHVRERRRAKPNRMNRTVSLLVFAASLGFTLNPARAGNEDASQDILDELRSMGYTVVDNTIAPSEWEKRTFSTKKLRLIRMRSEQEVPAWPHAYYRFVLEVEEFADSAHAAARLMGMRTEPPDLSVEQRKSFPLRDGFQLDRRVYILSTDVSFFYDSKSHWILDNLHSFLIDGETTPPSKPAAVASEMTARPCWLQFANSGERVPRCIGLNAQGKLLITARYLSRLSFDSHGLALVFSDDEGWTYVDRTGTVLVTGVPSTDNTPDSFHDGLVRIVRGKKYGFADRKGRIVIEPVYDGATSFWHGRAAVCNGCKAECIEADCGYSFTGGEWFSVNTKGEAAKMAAPN
jgi:hypothetical protein